MKRKRLILTTVLLVCVAAVVVPCRREIWLAVAYERTQVGEEWGATQLTTLPARSGMYFLKKRFAWLPGQSRIMPPQLCGYCQGEYHGDCLVGVREDYITLRMFHGDRFPHQLLVDEDFRCTCPNPRHRWCEFCEHRAHAQCREVISLPVSQWPRVEVDPRDYGQRIPGPCTCPEPSHEWNR